MVNKIIELEGEANRLSANTRARLRQILYEIECEGGYLARGYHCPADYFRDVFTAWRVTYLSQENAMKDYELLLGIPLGTYHGDDFVGFKSRHFLMPTVDQYSLDPKRYRRLSHRLDIAQKIRDDWRSMQEQYGEYPSGHEIRLYMLSKQTGKIKKPKEVTDESLKLENGRLKTRIKSLEEENRMLNLKIARANIAPIPLTTRQHIQFITEENEQLRNQLSKVKSQIRQSQRVG